MFLGAQNTLQIVLLIVQPLEIHLLIIIHNLHNALFIIHDL